MLNQKGFSCVLFWSSFFFLYPLWCNCLCFFAHPEKLDTYGGHREKEKGYHYHKPRASLSREIKKGLEWKEKGRSGVVRGVVLGQKRPDAVWLRLEPLPAFVALAQNLAESEIDWEAQAVRLWFRHLALELSAKSYPSRTSWIRKKVVHEVGQRLQGKKVWVDMQILHPKTRANGMIYRRKPKTEEESFNLWLMKEGWSFFLLEKGMSSSTKALFQSAEALARAKGKGVWQFQKKR